MTAAELLDTLNAAEIHVSAESTGHLSIIGDPDAVATWTPLIRAHKPALIRLLSESASAPAHPPPAANDSAATTYRCWTITDPDGECFTVTRCPPAALAEMQADYPGALVEPIPDPTDAPPELNPDDLALAYAYLRHVGETDTATGLQFIEGLARHPNGIAFLHGECVRLGLAVIEDDEDERRACRACLNLASNGDCLAARRGELPNASRRFGPSDPDTLHRCIRFMPGQADSDQRPGHERWTWPPVERAAARLPPKSASHPKPVSQPAFNPIRSNAA